MSENRTEQFGLLISVLSTVERQAEIRIMGSETTMRFGKEAHSSAAGR
jgi:hypothetical protein